MTGQKEDYEQEVMVIVLLFANEWFYLRNVISTDDLSEQASDSRLMPIA